MEAEEQPRKRDHLDDRPRAFTLIDQDVWDRFVATAKTMGISNNAMMRRIMLEWFAMHDVREQIHVRIDGIEGRLKEVENVIARVE